MRITGRRACYNRPVRTKLIFWAVVALLVAGGVCAYQAIPKDQPPIAAKPPKEKVPPTGNGDIVLEIPREDERDLLTKEELELVNGAAAKALGMKPPGRIVITSPQKIRAEYARVILISHGVAPRDARILAPAGGRPAGATPEKLPFEMLGAPKTAFKDRKHVAVILGNEPLDGSTPTIDLVRRALKGVEYQKKNPDSVLIFTGAPTVGGVSEAEMMALVAMSRRLPPHAFMLEEKATSTRLNAELSAKLIAGMDPQKIVVITKKSHLPWALPHFRKQPGMKDVEGLACDVTEKEIIAQMEEYLKHYENDRVKKRLKLLRAGKHGID